MIFLITYLLRKGIDINIKKIWLGWGYGLFDWCWPCLAGKARRELGCTSLFPFFCPCDSESGCGFPVCEARQAPSCSPLQGYCNFQSNLDFADWTFSLYFGRPAVLSWCVHSAFAMSQASCILLWHVYLWALLKLPSNPFPEVPLRKSLLLRLRFSRCGTFP